MNWVVVSGPRSELMAFSFPLQILLTFVLHSSNPVCNPELHKCTFLCGSCQRLPSQMFPAQYGLDFLDLDHMCFLCLGLLQVSILEVI